MPPQAFAVLALEEEVFSERQWVITALWQGGQGPRPRGLAGGSGSWAILNPNAALLTAKIHGPRGSSILYMLRIRVPFWKIARFPDVGSWLNYREICESLLSLKHTHARARVRRHTERHTHTPRRWHIWVSNPGLSNANVFPNSLDD